jgi:hypothetical protein
VDEPRDRRAPRRADLPATLRVPDDASSLEADRLAWLAEVQAARTPASFPGAGRAWAGRARAGRARAGRPVPTGPVVLLCILLTSLVAVVTVALAPRQQRAGSPPVLLAAVPALAVPPATAATTGGPDVEPRDGALLGRRLPALQFTGDVGPVAAADLRPALLLLLPPRCDCTAAVDVLVGQARSFRFEAWLVGGPGTTDADLAGIDADAASGAARRLHDRDGHLGRALGADGLTLAVVREDGVVAALQRRVPLEPDGVPALEPVLTLLSPTSGRPD